jgi:hypothetical protein
MKKLIGFTAIALICTTSLADISVKNNSIPFNKLPIEIKEVVQSEYIDTCQNISENEEMPVKNPKITFNKGFLVNVDFNGDGLKDYVIRSSAVGCEGAYSLFTGNSDGFIDIYFQNEAGKYDHVLNYWLGREGLELQKSKDGYHFTSEYNESYLAWDKSISKFISYYGPEKRKDILDINDENSTTSQTSTQIGEVLKQAKNAINGEL